MAKGDVASVAVQYGTLPSVLSFGKVDDARDMLDAAHAARPRPHPRASIRNGGGPQVLLYGESLGGWASQGVLDRGGDRAERRTGRPVDPLRELGIDTAVWIGIPGFSRFRRDRLGPGGMQSMSGVDAARRLSLAARARARAWELSHFDDFVHRADLASIWRRPKWLPKDGPTRRASASTSAGDRCSRSSTRSSEGPRHRGRGQVPASSPTTATTTARNCPSCCERRTASTDVTDAELARITEQVRQSEVWIMSPGVDVGRITVERRRARCGPIVDRRESAVTVRSRRHMDGTKALLTDGDGHVGWDISVAAAARARAAGRRRRTATPQAALPPTIKDAQGREYKLQADAGDRDCRSTATPPSSATRPATRSTSRSSSPRRPTAPSRARRASTLNLANGDNQREVAAGVASPPTARRSARSSTRSPRRGTRPRPSTRSAPSPPASSSSARPTSSSSDDGDRRRRRRKS